MSSMKLSALNWAYIAASVLETNVRMTAMSGCHLQLIIWSLFHAMSNKIEEFRFCGHEGSLSLMGHLLKSASVLEEVNVYTDIDDNGENNVDSEKLTICMDMLRLPRASKDCCVEFMK